MQEAGQQDVEAAYPEGVNGIEVANIINNPDPNIQYQLGVGRVNQISCRFFLGTFATVSILASTIIFMTSDLSLFEATAYGFSSGFVSGFVTANFARACTFPSNINERNLHNADGIRDALLRGGAFLAR